jgi:predicted flap endonuclease-1-like 5' DNA nuclease
MHFKLKELRSTQDTRKAAIEKLDRSGIGTTAQLLKAAADPKGRVELADKLGMTPQEVLEVANRADLSRVKGIGPVYSDLLEQAGVDTVLELSKRVPENLHKTLIDKGASHHTKRLPRLDEVQSWINQAKALDRRISY